jgi:hypothetical protein
MEISNILLVNSGLNPVPRTILPALLNGAESRNPTFSFIPQILGEQQSFFVDQGLKSLFFSIFLSRLFFHLF